MKTAYQIDYNEYLQHHGIKGQKWGVRNGPPYPLSASQKSASEKKTIDKSKNGSHTENNEFNRSKTKLKTVVERHRKDKASDLMAVGSGEMSGLVSYAAMYMALYGGCTLYVLHKRKQYRKERREELERLKKSREFRSINDVPKLSEKMSPEENMKVTNPDYPSDGTTSNCTFCTTAMAMREKGYDVQARKAPEGFHSGDLFQAAFDSPTVYMSRKTKTYQDVLNNLHSNGEGAYGNLTIRWKYGGGHSVFWKNENGKTRIYDGQDGEELDRSYAATFETVVDMKNIEYNRLDNCNPTEYALGLVESVKE